MSRKCQNSMVTIVSIFVLMVQLNGENSIANESPVADAGSSRYAAEESVQLDGRNSYDPDQSGDLSFMWTQVSGPMVSVLGPDTATPTVSGFVQTDEIQECEFEMVVSDGECDSLPDTVKVVVVPDFGENILRLENKSFDPNKPTFIYFGGGDCIIGYKGHYVWGVPHYINLPDWCNRANIIDFPYGYEPDLGGGSRTYYRYGDMILVYLSSVAPDYKQLIQTCGWSTGGQPAIDVGIHLNQIYADARYAVNRVTFFDATQYCRSNYSESVATYLASSVDGEQCWVDNYVSTLLASVFHGGNNPGFLNSVLNVGFGKSTDRSIPFIKRHALAVNWYNQSLMGTDRFNNGVVAGAYWSVIGPGKNLQLASTPDAQTYKFKWYGDASSGHMEFYDESINPGRLPEPVTLLAWRDEFKPNGIVLSCKPSENAISYQLICGTDSYHIANYSVISDTSHPPIKFISMQDTEKTWWTVRVRDKYGSTIYADPIQLDANDIDERQLLFRLTTIIIPGALSLIRYK